MPKVALLSQTGQSVGEITLNDSVFAIEPNQQAVYDVVKAQRAAMRQGTHKTKTRGEVRGGGRKPWRQKGTGRARAGTNRSPIWVGGGTMIGPTPRDYSLKVNRKVRRLALKSVLSQKLNDEKKIKNHTIDFSFGCHEFKYSDTLSPEELINIVDFGMFKAKNKKKSEKQSEWCPRWDLNPESPA